MRGRITRLSLALLISVSLSAQDPAVPPGMEPLEGITALSLEEDPPALFSLGEVIDRTELSLKGSWTGSLSSSPSLSWKSTGLTFGLSGLPLAFSQIPELEILLSFLDAWFFEASIGQDADKNAMALSFRGKEGAFLREFTAGNKDLAIPRILSLSLSQNAALWPGLSLSLGDQPGKGSEGPWRMSADGLLRYEEEAVEERIYRGKFLVHRAILGAADFIRGRFFILPDQGIREPRLFERDDSGDFVASDGMRYAERSLSGQSLSQSEGSLALSAPLKERCLFSYETPEGADPQGATESIDGAAALILYDPWIGRTAYEELNQYPLPEAMGEGGRLDARVSACAPIDPAVFSILEDSLSGSFRLLRQDHGQRNDPLAIRPFADAYPWIYELGGQTAGDVPASIFLEMYEEVDSFRLPLDAINSSIKVYIEGKESQNWKLEGSNLILLEPLSPTEELRIQYSRGSSTWAGLGATLSAGAAAEAYPHEDLSLHAGTGISWPLNLGQAETGGEAMPGRAVLEASLAWEPEDFHVGLSGNLAYDIADARDMVRLLPMESRSASLDPVLASWKIAGEPLLPSGLSSSARALPLYRDYLREGPFGDSLLGLDDLPEPEAMDPALKTGPYPVAEDVYGEALVLEAELGPASWTGIQTRVEEDFAALEPGSISFVLPVLWIPRSGELPTFSLQIGSIGPGMDEDGSPLEDPRAISSVDFSPTGEWSLVELPLDGGRLGSEGAGIRIIMHSVSAASGRLLIGEGFLRGSSFRVETQDPGALLVLEERGSLDAEEGPAAAFPQDYARLHADGFPNGYLRLSINSNPSSGAVTFSTALALRDISGYGRLSFYLRGSSDLSPASGLSLFLESAEGESRGWTANIGGWEGGWKRVDLDLSASSSSLRSSDGSSVPFGSLEGSNADLRRIVFRLEGAQTGWLDIDEVHLAAPRAQLSSRLEASLSWAPNLRVLPLLGSALFADPVLSFWTGAQLGNGALINGRAQASASLLWLRALLGAEASLAQGGDPLLSLNHELSLPLGGFEAKSRFSFSPGSAWTAFDMVSLGGGRNVLKLETASSTEEGAAESAWTLSGKLGMAGESLGLKASLGRESGQGTEAAELDYFKALWRSWVLRFSPGDASDQGRQASAELELRREALGHQDFTVEARMAQKGEPGSLSSGRLAASLSPSIPLGPGGFLSLTPRYGRSSTFSRSEPSASYGSDLEAWSTLMSATLPHWTAPPFSEFFNEANAALLEGLSFDPLSFSLDAETGISLDRAPGLGALDLLIPLRASWLYEEKNERRGSSLSRSASSSATLEQAAVDVFGVYGALPLSRLWDRDEYASSHRLGLEWQEETRAPDLSWHSEAHALLSKEGGGGLRLAEEFEMIKANAVEGQTWSNRFELEARSEDWASLSLDQGRRDLADYLSRRLIEGRGPRLPFLLDALESGRLRVYHRWKGGLKLRGDEGLSWECPLSWTAGLRLGSAMDAQGQLGCRASWSGEFSLGFSLQAELRFSF